MYFILMVKTYFYNQSCIDTSDKCIDYKYKKSIDSVLL